MSKKEDIKEIFAMMKTADEFEIRAVLIFCRLFLRLQKEEEATSENA